jgi:hypothetical protein
MSLQNHRTDIQVQHRDIEQHFNFCILAGMHRSYAAAGTAFLEAFLREPMDPDERSAEIAFIIAQMEAAR